jgi:hypothetical protein
MGKFTVTHEIRCDVETFWKVFLDKDFNERLFREVLGFPEFQITEQKETDSEIIRKVAGTPKMNMPGPVMKLLGNNFRYQEEGKLNKATKVWTWKMIPSVLADKLRQEGTMRVESSGPGKVRRVAEIVNEAKIFGLGGLIEGSAEKQLREGWDASATFMNKYIEQNASKA